MKNNAYYVVAFALMTMSVYICQAETLGNRMILKGLSTEFSSVPKSGKWIAEYGGAATPFRCVCAESLISSECIVGDTTSNTSLCE